MDTDDDKTYNGPTLEWKEILNDDESSFYFDGDIEPWKPNILTQEDAAKQKYPCLTPDGQTAEFWCEYSTENEGFVVLSQFPFPYPDASAVDSRSIPQHNVDIEIENLGIGYILTDDLSPTPEKCFKFLEEENLKPNIPFNVRIKVSYYKSGGYYDAEEWNSEIDWEIIK